MGGRWGSAGIPRAGLGTLGGLSVLQGKGYLAGRSFRSSEAGRPLWRWASLSASGWGIMLPHGVLLPPFPCPSPGSLCLLPALFPMTLPTDLAAWKGTAQPGWVTGCSQELIISPQQLVFPSGKPGVCTVGAEGAERKGGNRPTLRVYVRVCARACTGVCAHAPVCVCPHTSLSPAGSPLCSLL